MLAAKEAHKMFLKKKRAKWYELLDDSDSDHEETFDQNFDNLTSDLRTLNFNANTENYYKSAVIPKKTNSSNIGFKSETLLINHSVSKRQRNQLKTNDLRKSVTRMMNNNPDKSRIWNFEPIQ